jgi:hypothetical protein
MIKIINEEDKKRNYIKSPMTNMKKRKDDQNRQRKR